MVKNIPFLSIVLILGLFLLFHLGCAKTEPTRFYILSSIQNNETAREFGETESAMTIGIGPIKLPKYTERPQIVTRRSRNTLNLGEFDQWAEPLDHSVPYILIENLSLLLSTNRIISFPWSRARPINYQVAIDIIRFDGKPGDNVSLIANWTIYDKDGIPVYMKQRATYMESANGQGYEGMVEAMSRSLAALSRDIAASINSISQSL